MLIDSYGIWYILKIRRWLISCMPCLCFLLPLVFPSIDKEATAAPTVEKPMKVCSNAGESESSSKRIRLMQLDHGIDGT